MERTDSMDANSYSQLEDRQRRFRARAITRDVTRHAWVECDCDPESSQAMAQANAHEQVKDRLQLEFGPGVSAIIMAVVVNLIAKWIADHIRDWKTRGIKSPPLRYSPKEPGYMPEFEDDET